jgi:hypothetical protein
VADAVGEAAIPLSSKDYTVPKHMKDDQSPKVHQLLKYRGVKKAIQLLEEGGFIGVRPPSRREGMRTSIFPTSSLIDDFSMLKTTPPYPRKMVIDEDISPDLDQIIDKSWGGLQHDRKLKKNLSVINSHILSHKFELPIDHHRLWEGLFKPYSREFTAAALTLTRIFNGRSFQGRFHTAIHTIPHFLRPFILIDGEPVAEADFSSSQPSLAYALSGEKPPHDMKDPTGFISKIEDPVKKKKAKAYQKILMMQLLFNENLLFDLKNSQPVIRIKALRACLTSPITRDKKSGRLTKRVSPIEKSNHRNESENEFGAFIGEPVEQKPKLCWEEDSELIVSIAREIILGHEPIREWFGREKGAVILQNWEAQVAEAILLKAVAEQIPIYPIHDSFIVPSRHIHWLETTMRDSFSQILKVGWAPQVKSKGTLQHSSLRNHQPKIETGDFGRL